MSPKTRGRCTHSAVSEDYRLGVSSSRTAVLIVATYLVLVERSLSQAWFFVVVACLVSIGEAMRRLSKVNNVLQRANAAAALSPWK